MQKFLKQEILKQKIVKIWLKLKLFLPVRTGMTTLMDIEKMKINVFLYSV